MEIEPMPYFDLKWKPKDNSHPQKKVAIREWLVAQIPRAYILDVFPGNGRMFKRVWKSKAEKYRSISGDSIKWLNSRMQLNENLFDVDPYASPYEALEIIGKKAIAGRIGIACTDGTLRRAGMMRTKIPKYLQEKCGWPERDLSLLAGIYHQYPAYLRHVLNCICPQWKIEHLAVQYGKGTWKQATVYFAAVLIKQPTA